MATSARVLAGIPAVNNTLFHRIRFAVGDPAAWIEFTRADGTRDTLLIVRDIELDRARRRPEPMQWPARRITPKVASAAIANRHGSSPR